MRSITKTKKTDKQGSLTALSYFIAIVPADVFHAIATFLDVKSMLSARWAFKFPLHKNLLTKVMITSPFPPLFSPNDIYQATLILHEKNIKNAISDIDMWHALSGSHLEFYSKIKILLENTKKTNLQIPLKIQNKIIEFIKNIASILTTNFNAFEYCHAKNMLLLFAPYLDIAKKNECWNHLIVPFLKNNIDFHAGEQINIIKYIAQITTIFPEKIEEYWNYLTAKLNTRSIVLFHDQLLKSLTELAQLFPKKKKLCWAILENSIISTQPIYSNPRVRIQAIISLEALSKTMVEKREKCWNLIKEKLWDGSYDVQLKALTLLSELLILMPYKKEEFSYHSRTYFNGIQSSDRDHSETAEILTDLTLKFPDIFLEYFSVFSNLNLFCIIHRISYLVQEGEFLHASTAIEMTKIILNSKGVCENSYSLIEIFKVLKNIANKYPALATRCLYIIKNQFENIEADVKIKALATFSQIQKISKCAWQESIEPEYWSEISTIIYKIKNYRFLEYKNELYTQQNELDTQQNKLDRQHLILLTQCALQYPEKRDACLKSIVILLRRFGWHPAYDDEIICTWFSLKTRAVALLSLVQLSPLSDHEKTIIEFNNILEEAIPYYEMTFNKKSGDFIWSKPSDHGADYEADVLKPLTKFAFSFPEKREACWNLLTKPYRYLNLDRYFKTLLEYLIKLTEKFPKKRNDFFNFLIKCLHHENNNVVWATLDALHNPVVNISEVDESEWHFIIEKSRNVHADARWNCLLLLMKLAIKMQNKEKLVSCFRWYFIINNLGKCDDDGYHTVRKLIFSIKAIYPEALTPFFTHFNNQMILEKNFSLNVYSDCAMDPFFRVNTSGIENINTRLSVELLNLLYETLIPQLNFLVEIEPNAVASFNKAIYHYVNPLTFQFYKNKGMLSTEFNKLILILNLWRNPTPGTFAINSLHTLVDVLAEPNAHELRKILQEVFGETTFKNDTLRQPVQFKAALRRHINLLLREQTSLAVSIESRDTIRL